MKNSEQDSLKIADDIDSLKRSNKINGASIDNCLTCIENLTQRIERLESNKESDPRLEKCLAFIKRVALCKDFDYPMNDEAIELLEEIEGE